jgi:hypothetical protein
MSKDFSKYEVAEREWQDLFEVVNTGATSVQDAFGAMTSMILRHFEANLGDDGKVPRGFVARIKELFSIRGLTENKGNAKSYVGVSFNMAYNLANKRQSPALNYVWHEGHFNDLGEATATPTLRGAPLYSSSRIGAIMGKFNAKEDTPFEVTDAGILVNGQRWDSLTVTNLRDINKNGQKNPKVAQVLRSFLGNPDRLDKEPGVIGKAIKAILKENEALRSPAIKALADSFRGYLDTARARMQVTMLEAEAEALMAKKVEAQKKFLDTQAGKGGAPILDTPRVNGEAVTLDTEGEEPDEAFEQLEEEMGVEEPVAAPATRKGK